MVLSVINIKSNRGVLHTCMTYARTMKRTSPYAYPGLMIPTIHILSKSLFRKQLFGDRDHFAFGQHHSLQWGGFGDKATTTVVDDAVTYDTEATMVATDQDCFAFQVRMHVQYVSPATERR